MFNTSIHLFFEIDHLKRKEHLEHLNILQCSSVEPVQYQNRRLIIVKCFYKILELNLFLP